MNVEVIKNPRSMKCQEERVLKNASGHSLAHARDYEGHYDNYQELFILKQGTSFEQFIDFYNQSLQKLFSVEDDFTLRGVFKKADKGRHYDIEPFSLPGRLDYKISDFANKVNSNAEALEGLDLTNEFFSMSHEGDIILFRTGYNLPSISKDFFCEYLKEDATPEEIDMNIPDLIGAKPSYLQSLPNLGLTK